MDAGGLEDGFRTGDWLIEPRLGRASTADVTRELTGDPLRLLMRLACNHGEAVDRRALRSELWPGQPGADRRLQEAVAALRELFGETARRPRYIASVGTDAYALIAHFELLPPAAPAVPAAVGDTPAPPPDSKPSRSIGARLQRLPQELRRRSVFKVAASYLVGMWLVLQVAQTTFEPLRFPGWWMTALTIIAVIGLPIVVVLAWTYEITPEGIVFDSGVDGVGVARRLPRARQSIAPFIVAGVALMAAVTGFAWWRSLGVPTDAAPQPALEAGPRSIAVLPLVDMSPAGGNEYLGDGLSEELSTRLAQMPGLRVAARTSAFEFRGRNLDVRKIGQSLGVRHVLEGSVRRNGDTVRVTVQLIDTATGFHTWAGNFDRPWRDVLALQDDIAESVTAALQVVLKDRPAQGDATQVHEVDPRAIDPYLAGLASLRQPGDLSRLQQAVQSFQQAIAIDPQFAGAYAGLCRTQSRLYDRTRDPAALAAAEQSCRQSLELDPSLLETEKALASLATTAGRYEAGAAAYRKLLQRAPEDADAHMGLARALEGLGQGPEAEASFRRAVAVDPSYWNAYSSLGSFLFQRGKAAEAVAAYRRATELVPSSAFAWNNLGGALLLQGDFTHAVEAYDRSLRLEPSKDAYSNLATANYYLGHFADAISNSERAAALGEHDQQVIGNLGDALWQVPARRDEAIATYRRAITLAAAELQATPANAMLRAQLGYYYGRAGDAVRSQQYLDEASASGPDVMYVQYYVAVAAADRGDRAKALAAVAALVRLGYPPALLRSAPEFRSLVGDADYQKAIGAG